MGRLMLALAAAFALLGSPARAEERILSFVSDIMVQPDGDLLVAETIRVRAEGEKIRHGIFREIPTVYGKGLFGGVRVPFELLEVRRDGAPEPWTSEAVSNGLRIRIGDADGLLDPGVHDYLIRYRIGRQIGFFDGYDELYWNVTGTGWDFPIDLAEARIRLPRPARFGGRAVYTGPVGAGGQDAAVVADGPQEIVFRTSAPLERHEGLTVAVAWPKGIVAPPDSIRRTGWWIGDNGPPFIAFLALAALLAYYFHAWRVAGRGPPAGTVMPIFSPPDGLSAAAMRYVHEMGADNRTFAAALIDLGVRGYVRLVEGEKKLFSNAKTTIERRSSGGALPAPESAMATALFAKGDRIVMENKNHDSFGKAQKALSSELKKLYEGRLFVRNWGWSLRGLGLVLATIWLVAAAILLTSPAADPRAPGLLLLTPILAATAFLAGRSGGAWLIARLLAWLGFAAAGALAIVAIGMALAVGRIVPLLIPLAALPFVVTAFWWMAAPTRAGRAVLDRIEGFKQYLSITEEERLERMHPPERTPELFEKYLPYAIALNVENAWADRFAGVLAAASAAQHAQTMAWYSGHADPWRDPGDFADRMGSSLAGTVAAASTAPGSSSGSGGGGSSGGGGGGGGGGGW